MSCCKDCNERNPGCHSTCRNFKAYNILKAVQDAKKKEYLDAMRFEKEARIRRVKAAKEAVHGR